MFLTRTSAALVGGAILTALIASPALMRTSAPPAAASRPFTTETRRVEIAPTRLPALLAARAGAVQTTRNPFVFATRPQPAPPAPKPVAAPAIVEAPAPPPKPPIALAAIAEQAGENGVVIRTAVLSLSNQVYLVKEGERAASRFTVLRVTADVVELRDETTAAIVRLALR